MEKYILFLENLNLTVNCSCEQNESTKQKEVFHLVNPRTKQQKQSFEFYNLKNVSIASIGNSNFR